MSCHDDSMCTAALLSESEIISELLRFKISTSYLSDSSCLLRKVAFWEFISSCDSLSHLNSSESSTAKAVHRIAINKRKMCSAHHLKLFINFGRYTIQTLIASQSVILNNSVILCFLYQNLFLFLMLFNTVSTCMDQTRSVQKSHVDYPLDPDCTKFWNYSLFLQFWYYFCGLRWLNWEFYYLLFWHSSR